MSEKDDVGLEKAKLELERDKFTLEQRKFEADAETRSEELLKLKADREAAQLSAQDLRSPFYAKPPVISAVFQGVAVLLAVISGIVGLNVWGSKQQATIADLRAEKAALVATQAQQDAASALQKKADAEKDAAKAAFDAGQARAEEKLAEETKVEALSARDAALLHRDKAVEQAREAALAPIDQALSKLSASSYYPILPISGDNWMRMLTESIRTADVSINAVRIRHMEDYAEVETNPLGVRLSVLRVLYDEATRSDKAADLSPSQIRGQIAVVATSIHTRAVDPRALDSLHEFLRTTLRLSDARREMSRLLCSEYWPQYESGQLNTDFTRTLESYIYAHLIPDLDPKNDNCAVAGWDWLSREADSWRYEHLGWDRIAVKTSEAKEGEILHLSEHSEPPFLALLRNINTGHPRADESGQILLDLPVAKGQRTVSIDGNLIRFLLSENGGPEPNQDDPVGTFRNFKNWMEQHQDIIKLLNESETETLKRCRQPLLSTFQSVGIFDRADVERDCGAKTDADEP